MTSTRRSTPAIVEGRTTSHLASSFDSSLPLPISQFLRSVFFTYNDFSSSLALLARFCAPLAIFCNCHCLCRIGRYLLLPTLRFAISFTIRLTARCTSSDSHLLSEESNEGCVDGAVCTDPMFDHLLHHPMNLNGEPDATHHVLQGVTKPRKTPGPSSECFEQEKT